MASVSVIILSYNSKEKLADLLPSLARQTYRALEIIIVDNHSQDDTVAWLNEQTILKIDQLLEQPTNAWYAKGNNIGINAAQGEYLLFCNDDVVLEPTCIEQLVQAANENGQRGMVGGKLLKLTTQSQQPIIDSAGIKKLVTGKAINRGENEIDQGQYNNAEEVFGITGALMLVRRTALEQINCNGEYFDEDFIAYKEDIDFSWRMKQHGFKIWYVPTAVAYHARTIQQTDLTARKKKLQLIRSYSYRNHLWTLIKNETLVEFVSQAWAIIPYELAKLIYICLFEWATVAIIPETIKGINRMRKKRLCLK